ncbi:MAG: DUF4397 domain-containing protein [Marinoscillum sp.]
MKTNRKRLRLNPIIALLSCVLLLGVISCKDDEEDLVTPETAYVSLYHASPNASGLDILVDNRQINSYPFEYSENTGYLRFYTGSRDLKFTPFNASNSIIDTTTVFEDGSAYSVFVTGDYPEVEALIVKDDSERPSEGKAKIRIAHLAPDASEVNLLTSSAEDPIIDLQSYKTASDFMEIESGGHDFDVTDQDGNVLLNVDDINLSSGIYYTLIVKGFVSPPQGNENYLSAEVLVN